MFHDNCLALFRDRFDPYMDIPRRTRAKRTGWHATGNATFGHHHYDHNENGAPILTAMHNRAFPSVHLMTIGAQIYAAAPTNKRVIFTGSLFFYWGTLGQVGHGN